MKVAVTVESEAGLESEVAARFGRSRYFGLVELESDGVETVANPGFDAQSGAGVDAAQLVADKQVDAVITGKVGPKAFKGLKQAGIEVYTASGLSLEAAVNKLKQDQLDRLDSATSKAHSGLK